MIQEINIHNIATYAKPVSMRPLNINFIYGSNGSGKSTLANLFHGDISSKWEVHDTCGYGYNNLLEEIRG